MSLEANWSREEEERRIAEEEVLARVQREQVLYSCLSVVSLNSQKYTDMQIGKLLCHLCKHYSTIFHPDILRNWQGCYDTTLYIKQLEAEEI